MPEELTVKISDMKVSRHHGDVLVTHSLGSCLGLAVYDPKAMVAGLVHCLLPSPGSRQEEEGYNPCMYVTTGVPFLVKAMYALGAARHRLVLKAAGCARMINLQNRFDIGAANWEALKKLLQKNNTRLTARDVGGTIPRTMRLHVDQGRLVISSLGKKKEL